jgi:hypothetical protein
MVARNQYGSNIKKTKRKTNFGPPYEGYSIRDIAMQELMSFRDIGSVCVNRKSRKHESFKRNRSI